MPFGHCQETVKAVAVAASGIKTLVAGPHAKVLSPLYSVIRKLNISDVVK